MKKALFFSLVLYNKIVGKEAEKKKKAELIAGLPEKYAATRDKLSLRIVDLPVREASSVREAAEAEYDEVTALVGMN